MQSLIIAILSLAVIACTAASNVSFKWSALSPALKGFLWWQLVGNLAGFMSVLSFTFLLRFIPLYLAYAVTAGLGFISVQVFGAHLIFHEAITATQWFGIALITTGIIVVSLGGK
jgi:multidrug transporter EmrE-like cation transporter